MAHTSCVIFVGSHKRFAKTERGERREGMLQKVLRILGILFLGLGAAGIFYLIWEGLKLFVFAMDIVANFVR